MSQSLERGLHMLTELAGGSRTLEQLADALGVHKSTALRLLRTLEANRFVRRTDVHNYRLGSALFELANRALDELDLRSVAGPHLGELGRVTGHTVHLAMYEDDQVVYIDKVDSRHPVRMYSRIGNRAPVHCTAVGKVLVAEWGRQRREELVNRMSFPKLTANTITCTDAFLAELDRVRGQGYAVDHGEHEEFIHCLAAPIRDSRGEVSAALSVSAPKVVLGQDELLGLVDDLLLAARRVSEELR